MECEMKNKIYNFILFLNDNIIEDPGVYKTSEIARFIAIQVRIEFETLPEEELDRLWNIAVNRVREWENPVVAYFRFYDILFERCHNYGIFDELEEEWRNI
jgi:hypothetical protein